MPRPNYSVPEVKALVELYAELREKKGVFREGLQYLVLLADLDRAIYRMPPKEYQAVLLHGLLGYTVRNAETLLGVSKSTLDDRYAAGVAWLTDFLNGDNDE